MAQQISNNAQAMSAKCPAGAARADFSVSDVAGLQLRVSASGKKVWRLKSRKTGVVTVGEFPGITLHEARVVARQLLADADKRRLNAETGKDLLDVKDRRTVSDLLDDYQRRRSAAVRSWSFQRRQIENVYAALLRKPARLVTEDDMLAPVLNARTVTAKRAASYLSAVLRHSRLGQPARRAALDDAVPERPRDRVLSDDEVARIVASSSPGLDLDFFRGLVLTAQRSGDLLAMQIEDVDLDAGVWTFQMQKSRSRDTVHLPLSTAMMDLIRTRVGTRTHGPVFVGTRGSEVGNLGRRLRALQAASQTSDWSWHDCRRTSRTWMGRAGVPSYVAEKALGHATRGVEGVYDRWSYGPQLRKAFEAVAAELARLEHGGGNVVRLPDRGR